MKFAVSPYFILYSGDGRSSSFTSLFSGYGIFSPDFHYSSLRIGNCYTNLRWAWIFLIYTCFRHMISDNSLRKSDLWVSQNDIPHNLSENEKGLHILGNDDSFSFAQIWWIPFISSHRISSFAFLILPHISLLCFSRALPLPYSSLYQ